MKKMNRIAFLGLGALVFASSSAFALTTYSEECQGFGGYRTDELADACIATVAAQRAIERIDRQNGFRPGVDQELNQAVERLQRVRQDLRQAANWVNPEGDHPGFGPRGPGFGGPGRGGFGPGPRP